MIAALALVAAVVAVAGCADVRFPAPPNALRPTDAACEVNGSTVTVGRSTTGPLLEISEYAQQTRTDGAATITMSTSDVGDATITLAPASELDGVAGTTEEIETMLATLARGHGIARIGWADAARLADFSAEGPDIAGPAVPGTSTVTLVASPSQTIDFVIACADRDRAVSMTAPDPTGIAGVTVDCLTTPSGRQSVIRVLARRHCPSSG